MPPLPLPRLEVSRVARTDTDGKLFVVAINGGRTGGTVACCAREEQEKKNGSGTLPHALKTWRKTHAETHTHKKKNSCQPHVFDDVHAFVHRIAKAENRKAAAAAAAEAELPIRTDPVRLPEA